MKQKPNLAAICLIPFILLVTTLCIFIQNFANLENVRIDNQAVENFEDGWTLQNGSTAVFPVSLAESPSLSKTLPTSMTQGYTLCINTFATDMDVYIDNTLVYQHHSADKSKIGAPYSFLWNFIYISKEYAGHKITIEADKDAVNSHSTISGMTFGTKSATVFYLLKQNAVALIFVLISMVISFLLYLSAFLFKEKRMFLLLATFAALSSIWMLIDTNLLQFFVENQALLHYLSFCTFKLMTIPLFLFFHEIIHSEKTDKLKYFTVLLYLDLIISVLCGLFNLPLQFYMIRATHVIIMAASVWALYSIVSEYIKIKSKNIMLILIGFLALLGCAMSDLVLFYFSTGNSNSKFFLLGLFAFTLTLVAVICIKTRTVVEDGLHAKVLKRLAFFDALTGLGNRAMFDMDMRELNSSINTYSYVCIIAFDVNNLKKVNDTQGHKSGDLLIQTAASCIEQGFLDFGKAYRIGGDEFIVLSSNRNEIMLKKYILNFDNLITKRQADFDFDLSIAKGWVLENTSDDINVFNMLELADKKMYEEKYLQKQKQGI